MAIKIKLSEKTKALVKQLEAINAAAIPHILQVCDEIELEDFKDWFKKEQILDKEANFLIESLHAALLKDLLTDLQCSSTAPTSKKQKPKPSWSSRAKFIFLAIAGTIFFGCEGFDGITAMLGIFSLPTVAIFAAGTLFSLLSIVVFYSFDLVEISKNLGVKVKHAPKMLDIYLKEFGKIKEIREQIAKSNFVQISDEELEKNLAVIDMLIQRHKALDKDRQKFKDAMNNKFLQGVKITTAATIGIIFFSGGFFAGQTVALAVAGLFVASVAATAWPIVLASLVVGLAALSVYWFVERPGIEKLISRRAGLDPKKIEQLCGDKAVREESENLANLKEKLTSEKGVREVRKKEKGDHEEEKKEWKAKYQNISSLFLPYTGKPALGDTGLTEQSSAANHSFAGKSKVANQGFFGRSKSVDDLLIHSASNEFN